MLGLIVVTKVDFMGCRDKRSNICLYYYSAKSVIWKLVTKHGDANAASQDEIGSFDEE